MAEELRTSFHEELDTIKTELLKMSEYVISIIPQVTEAFLKKDLKTTQTIIDNDDPLDISSVALDERCCQALALQQPMAKDLRHIISAMSINNDIERSGDLAVNIAKAAHRLKDSTLNQDLKEIIRKMGEQAQILLRNATDAYSHENLELANELEDADDILDQLNYDCVLAAHQANTNGDIDLHTTVQMVLLGRYYERIGDHAVNIGERIHYMLTGSIGGKPQTTDG